jgi:hypothetical protein
MFVCFFFFFPQTFAYKFPPHSRFSLHSSLDFQSPLLRPLSLTHIVAPFYCSTPPLHVIRHPNRRFLSPIIAPHSYLSPPLLLLRHPTFVTLITLHPPFTIVMNAFPNCTRVFYWDVNGTIKYGTVESTSRMTDGTQVVNVLVDSVTQEQRRIPDGAGGFIVTVVRVKQKVVSLPVSSLSKVT